jgi:RimJ/RimL family protein N-acetyltransferase
MIVRAMTQKEIREICAKINFSYNSNSNGILIEDENGGVGAAAIYDRWTHTAVEMHAYSAGPKYVFRPEFCRAMFDYPFNQQNKMLAFAVTPCDNIASIALARFLGFKEVYRIRDGWDSGTDMVIQEIRRENCRFLEQNTMKVSNGQFSS